MIIEQSVRGGFATGTHGNEISIAGNELRATNEAGRIME